VFIDRDLQIAPGQTANVGGVTIENLSEQPVLVTLTGDVLVVTAPPGFVPEVTGASCEPVDGDPSSLRCVVAPGARITVRVTVAGVARQATPPPTPVPPSVAGAVVTNTVAALPRAGVAEPSRPLNRSAALLAIPLLLTGTGLFLLRRRSQG
jgi:hypothetical protein